MPDALPESVAAERRDVVLDSLRAAAPRGLRTGELQLRLSLGEHPTYAVLRDLEAAGWITTNGRSRSARRWILTDSPPPSPDAPGPGAIASGSAEPNDSAGASGGGPGAVRRAVVLRHRIAEALDLDPNDCTDEDLVEDVREALAERAEGVLLRHRIAESLDLDAERCADQDLVEDVREAIADRCEAEAESAELRQEVLDLREVVKVLHTALDGLDVPPAPRLGRAASEAAWRLGQLRRSAP